MRRRRLAAAGAVAVILLAVYLVFLRDSSLFAVDQVEVSGVTANQERITAALVRASEDMTTLHVREDDLRKAVGTFPTVAALSTSDRLSPRPQDQVTERPPVAVAKIDGEPTPVSETASSSPGSTSIRRSSPPSTPAPARTPASEGEGAAQAAILAAAPEELRPRLRAATWDLDRGGVVVDLDGAPELRFGEGDRGARQVGGRGHGARRPRPRRARVR